MNAEGQPIANGLMREHHLWVPSWGLEMRMWVLVLSRPPILVIVSITLTCEWSANGIALVLPGMNEWMNESINQQQSVSDGDQHESSYGTQLVLTIITRGSNQSARSDDCLILLLFRTCLNSAITNIMWGRMIGILFYYSFSFYRWSFTFLLVHVVYFSSSFTTTRQPV